jgi:hypothetical protein
VDSPSLVRRALAEALAAFALVFAGCGAIVADARCATATPQVDHLLTTPICSDCGADLAALDEVALELVAHRLEA